MLVQAKEKKMREMQNSRESEINEVMKLRADLEREKQNKLMKRKKEREEALIVIRENEEEKKKRMAQKEQQRLDQIRLMEEYEKSQDDQER